MTDNKALRDAISHAQGMACRYGAIKAQEYPRYCADIIKDLSAIDTLIETAECVLSGGVPIPHHEDQAVIMVLLGTAFLQDHAPHRLRDPKVCLDENENIT